MEIKKSQKQLMEKWADVINVEGAPAIKDSVKLKTITQVLENSEAGLIKGELQPSILTEADGSVSANFSNNLQGDRKGYDPVLFSLVRRSMPNLMSFDTMGVQAMNGPTGLIFAMRPKFVDRTDPNNPILGGDAFYDEADTDFSGTGTHAGTAPGALNDAVPGTYTTGTGMTTLAAEKLGTSGGNAFKEMGFSIDKVTISATSRKLKGTLTNEIITDLRAIHGIDAGAEITNILNGEIVAEINREMIRSIYFVAKKGAQHVDLTTAGEFDVTLDSNGRWARERFLGIYFQIQREANVVARETRRGLANFVIVSPDLGAALNMAGVLSAPANIAELSIDPTGNTFAGYLGNGMRVYIDPYASGDFFVVGYKGQTAYDAGLYFAPYQMYNTYKAQDPNSFQPVYGIESRYAVAMNPFAKGTTAPSSTGALEANSNVYFRRVKIKNLMDASAGTV